MVEDKRVWLKAEIVLGELQACVEVTGNNLDEAKEAYKFLLQNSPALEAKPRKESPRPKELRPV